MLYSAPGFVWGQLESKAQEEYSLSTERFLRASGKSQVANDSGVAEIPIAAAYNAVVGRKGDLYGRVVERGEGEVWKLALSPHNTLAVEVFDTRGLPVVGVRIIGENRPSFSNPFARQSRLGTTDENGLVTHLFKVPDPQGMPQKLSVFVSLPAGNYGAFELNPAAPPRQPVRITLPPAGSVTVHILDPSGNHLDPSILGDPNVEIVVLDPAAPPPRTSLPFASQTRQRARIEADGIARFRNVILGRTMSISAPTLLGTPIEFSGPREGKVDVLVEHRMHRDHPAVVGRLVDTNHRPIRNTHFSILCRSGDELLSLVGGVTDDRGWFLAYLAEKAMGMQPGEITFGMAWKGMSQSRAVRVPVRGRLTGRVQVGDVVLPEEE